MVHPGLLCCIRYCMNLTSPYRSSVDAHRRRLQGTMYASSQAIGEPPAQCLPFRTSIDKMAAQKYGKFKKIYFLWSQPNPRKTMSTRHPLLMYIAWWRPMITKENKVTDCSKPRYWESTNSSFHFASFHEQSSNASNEGTLQLRCCHLTWQTRCRVYSIAQVRHIQHHDNSYNEELIPTRPFQCTLGVHQRRAGSKGIADFDHCHRGRFTSFCRQEWRCRRGSAMAVLHPPPTFDMWIDHK